MGVPMLRRTRPREETGREWDQPDKSQQYGQACNDLGVDPASLWPGVNLTEGGEIVADDTSDDLIRN